MKVPASEFERSFGCVNSGEGYGIIARGINAAAIIDQNIEKSQIIAADEIKDKFINERKNPISITRKHICDFLKIVAKNLDTETERERASERWRVV